MGGSRGTAESLCAGTTGESPAYPGAGAARGSRPASPTPDRRAGPPSPRCSSLAYRARRAATKTPTSSAARSNPKAPAPSPNRAAIAVDNNSGDVFVFDRATNTVDRYGAAGTCIEAFKVGPRAKGAISAEGIAVDNAAGSPRPDDLYVVNKQAHVQTIEKYKFEGGKAVHAATISTWKNGAVEQGFGDINGIAVDSKGQLGRLRRSRRTGRRPGSIEGSPEIATFSNGEPNAFVSALSVESEAECTCPPGAARLRRRARQLRLLHRAAARKRKRQMRTGPHARQDRLQRRPGVPPKAELALPARHGMDDRRGRQRDDRRGLHRQR